MAKDNIWNTGRVHWILQRGVLRPQNLDRLIAAIERAGSPYTTVSITEEGHLDSDVDPEGPVIVSGAIRMAAVAESKGWWPGSFLNENFNFEIWRDHLETELLNATATFTTPGRLTLTSEQFVRPLDDTKSFAGQVFDPDSFAAWKQEHGDLLDIAIVAGPVHRIYREYRLFVIRRAIVTGSLYMQAGEPNQSPDIDPEALSYAQSIVDRWQPADAFVLDIGLADDGYRIIEYNNINSCGFYSSDVQRYVQAMEAAFDPGAPGMS